MALISSSSSDIPGTLPSAEVDRLSQRPWPNLDDQYRLHGNPPGPAHIHILAEPEALSQITTHGQSNRRKEVGGALLGHVFRSNGSIFVEIAAALPAHNEDHSSIHFTFTADVWAQLTKDRALHFPALEIVGWFHTHPNLGVFYSGDDVVVHSAAFTLPWQMGLVLDPVRNEAGFFGWIDGRLAPIPGYYEKRSADQEADVPWRIVSTSIWSDEQDPSQEKELGAEDSFQAALTESSWSSFPTRLQTGLGVLGLIFLLLIGWVGLQSRQISRLEQMALLLAAKTEQNTAVCPDRNLWILIPSDGQTFVQDKQVNIMGTAVVPESARYRVEYRPDGGSDWILIKSTRRDIQLGQLGRWDTEELDPGAYEMRLTAVDRNNIIVNGVQICHINVRLSN